MTSPAGRRTSGLLPARKAGYMHGRKPARSKVASPQQLDKMIEEATVDCYDEQEQASGFFTMIEDNLVFPFTARVFGIDVSVVGIEMDDDGSLKVVCGAWWGTATYRPDRSAVAGAAAGGRRVDRCLPALAARPVTCPWTNTLISPRASSSRMVWLNADRDMPSFAAAFVKLRSRPTATKARRSSRFPRCIYRACS